MRKGRRSGDGLPVPREQLEAWADDPEFRWLDRDGLAEALGSSPLVCGFQADEVEGAWFDPAAVVRALRALSALKHTKTRRWSGTPLRPDPWQIVWILAPVFGWKNPDGDRIIRVLWCELPRKNGKSTLSSGIGLVLFAADDEPGAEVYAAASSRGQAGIVFGEAKTMAMASPALRSKVQALAQVMRHPKSGSIFLALSRIADAAHGLNVHGGIIDEVHVHKSRDLIDAIETGTGARSQPLIVFITTADDGDLVSIYAEKHNYTRQVADRTVKDPSHYGVIWAAEDTDDPFALATIRKANPGCGRSVSEEYLLAQAAKAQTTPSYFPTYARLHLNRRIRVATKWLDLQAWDLGAGMVVEEELAGRDCYGGLDLSNVSDFAGYVLLFPPADDDKPERCERCSVKGKPVKHLRWRVLPRIWVPRAAIEKRGPMRNQLLAWEKAGWLRVTDGDMTHYDAIESAIGADASKFNLLEMAYDPWNVPQLVSHLQDGGLTVWPLNQTVSKLNAPAKWIESLVGSHLLNHGGHPVLRWMAANAITRGDANGNIAPDKQKSAEKIDGISALVNAAGAATRDRDEALALDGSLMA